MITYRRRWSDNDRYFGPFTYARQDKHYRPWAVVLASGDDDGHPGASLRMSGFGRTLIVALPPVLRPWRQKVAAKYWSADDIARMGRDWYWDINRREYGFSYSEGFLQVFLGRQTNDSSTTQDWCRHLPWTQWRHVRHSFYGLQGEHFGTVPSVKGIKSFDAMREIEEACPSVTFAFADFDGEKLTARTHIEEREWRFGEGWFKWLSVFRKPRIRRDLDIHFSGETGKRKGSWKGGTIGHSIEMLPGELHDAAFRRYCAEHQMTFGG